MGQESASEAGQRPNDPPGQALAAAGGNVTAEPKPAPLGHGHHPHIEIKFLEELRKRNVIRVALLYLVVCWLILEPIHVVFHMLEVPGWANRLVLILMVIGLPVAVVFAWAFEVTPEGLKPTVDVDPKESIRSHTGRRLDRAIIVVLLLGTGYLLVDKVWLSRRAIGVEQQTLVSERSELPTSSPAAPHVVDAAAMSVAIMSFTALTEDAGTIRLAKILPRELSTVLVACCHLLKVIAGNPNGIIDGGASASRQGQQLAARYVIDGDVRGGKAAKSVSLRLNDTLAGAQVWSTPFELPDLDGSFDASRRLRKLAALLARAVQEAETRRVLAKPLERLDAIELTLRGVAAEGDGDRLEEVMAAHKLFDAALRLDPNLVYGIEKQTDSWDLVRDLDPSINLQRLLQQMDELSRHAVDLDATDPAAWHMRFLALADAGRWSAAIEAMDRAIRLDPFRADRYAWKGWMMNMLGRPADALPLTDRAISLDPDEPSIALRSACEAYLLLGKNDQAISTCERAAGTNPDWFITSFLAAAYANRGDIEKASAAKEEMLRKVPGYTIAQLRAKHYSDVPEYLKTAEATWYAGLRKAGFPEK